MVVLFISIVIAFLLGSVGLALVGFIRDEGRRLAEVRKRETTPLANVDPGRHEVVGTIETKGSGPAPVTGVLCVAAWWEVVYFDAAEKEQTLRGTFGEHLWFRDDTGRGRVVVEGAERQMVTLHMTAGPKADERTPDAVMALFEEREVEPKRVDSWFESRFEPGDPLYVLGNATVEKVHDGTGGYRGQSTVAVFEGEGDDGPFMSNGLEAEVIAGLASDRKSSVGCAVALFAIAAAVLAFGLLWSYG